MDQGFIFAILTILLFGSWAVPTKTLKIESTSLAFWLTIGHLFVSLVIYVFNPAPLSAKDFLGPFLAGVMWAVGIVFGYIGIKNIGVTRAIGTWIPVIIITSTLWGLLFFKEIALLGTNELLLTILSVFLLIASGLIIVFSSKGESKISNLKAGLIASIVLGVLHGSFFIPLRTSSLPFSVSFLPLSVGMVTTMFLIIFSKKVKVKYDLVNIFRMISAGLILGLGNYLAQLTMNSLGVSRGYPLTQLAIIVNALWGVIVFKEATSAKSKALIALSIVVALIGAILLNIVRTNNV